MNQEDYEHFATVLKARSGIDLGPGKEYLLQSRLSVIAISAGFKDVAGLLAGMRRSPDATLLDGVVDAMTTNETFFFRDNTPFDQFRTHVLPALYAARRGQPIRIWCAACSTGQEPYSLAMIVEEERHKYPGLKVDILGTDISDRCLQKARAGLYSQFEVQRGLPVQLLVKYFEKADAAFRVKDSLRRSVNWRKLNLLDNLKTLGRFDVVFIRNVLIYFDRPTKTKILDAVAAMLPEDGFMYLGAAETVLGLNTQFKASETHRSLYSKAAPLGVSFADRAEPPRVAMGSAAS